MIRTVGTRPGRRTQILPSNPAELMLLLCDAAICYCDQARSSTERQQFEEAHLHLVKAEKIVMELAWGLRRDARPGPVDSLSRLFEFVFLRLFEANVSHNTRCIDEALNALTVLREVWGESIEKSQRHGVGRTSPAQAGAIEPRV